jgi:hypothetical protein
VSGQLHAPTALPRGKSPRYPLDRRLGGPQSGLDDLEKRKFLTPPGLELQSLSRPARSQSLYRLRYSGSGNRCIECWNETQAWLHNLVKSPSTLWAHSTLNQVLILLICNRKVGLLGSIHGRHIDHPDWSFRGFSQSLRTNAGIVLSRIYVRDQ